MKVSNDQKNMIKNMSDKETILRLNTLHNQNIRNYYLFFDETIFTDFTICAMLITNDRLRLNSLMKEIRRRAHEDFSHILKKYGGTLHFTDLLNEEYTEFLEWALKKLVKAPFFFFIERPVLEMSNPKINAFHTQFIDFSKTMLWKKNNTIVIDEAYSTSIVSKYYVCIMEQNESSGAFTIIPDSQSLQNDLKEHIKKCQTFDVLPVEIANRFSDYGLQAVDFAIGAFRQYLKGNNVYFNIIKEKILPQTQDKRFADGLRINY